MKRAIRIFAVCATIVGLFLLESHDLQRARSVLAASQTHGSGKSVATIRFVKNPEPVPQFTLKDLDGKAISQADWRGKVVLLNFWATWCPPCREEIPELVKLQSKYAPRLQIIGLSVDQGPAEPVNRYVKRFVQQQRINYPVAVPSPELQAEFGSIVGLPTAFLLDKNGRVVQKHIGLRDPVLYETEVRALLGLPVDAKIETFEDFGQVFPANAKRATELPGVDFSKLTPEQKKVALRQLNEQMCTCGCRLTLAQCRINDSTCPVSLKLAAQVEEKVLRESVSQEARPHE
jgi:thiol-disulfide isomerase/thioredoxin